MTRRSNQPVANLIAPENETDVDEATSETQAVANITSTRRSPGLQDLPPGASANDLPSSPNRPGRDIPWLRGHCAKSKSTPFRYTYLLRTNRLTYREAFEVFYRENQFVHFVGDMTPLANTIQSIHVEVTLFDIFVPVIIFLDFIPQTTNPSIAHYTFTVDFVLSYSISCPLPLASLGPSQMAQFPEMVRPSSRSIYQLRDDWVICF